MQNIKKNQRQGRRSVGKLLASLYLRIFAPRQVIIRQATGVKVFRLASGFQFTVSLFLLASLVMSAVTLYGYFGKSSQNQKNRLILQAAKERIHSTTEQNERDRLELEATRETLNHYRVFLTSLAQNKRELANSGQVGPKLSSELKASADAIIRAEAEIEKNLASLRGVKPEVTVSQMLAAQTAALQDQAQKSSVVNASFSSQGPAPQNNGDQGSVETMVQGASLQQMVSLLRQQLKQSNERMAEMQATLNNNNAAFNQMMTEKRTSLAMVDGLKAKAVAAELKVKELQAQQNAEVIRLTASTNRVVGNLEKLLRSTGMNIREVIPLEKPKAATKSGGPFIPWKGGDKDQAVLTGRSQDQQIRANFNQSLDKLNSLSKVFYQIPFSQPLSYYSVTSKFGPRADPFNGRMAKHEGLDMGVPMGTEVMATAPGTVIFAGERGAYGNLVEIVHGNGISTRYAHMSKLLVKVGQRVNRHQAVGLSGSTGRSQGPHLHYEVRVNGIARNPVNFLRAKSNVLQ
ncbi:MAG: M23 family metallopeptidase [Candidatus Pacebacteria bacterium]|nr:M23 family metallopeptidase [Candidatus Paceibacterota bacterium]